MTRDEADIFMYKMSEFKKLETSLKEIIEDNSKPPQKSIQERLG